MLACSGVDAGAALPCVRIENGPCTQTILEELSLEGVLLCHPVGCTCRLRLLASTKTYERVRVIAQEAEAMVECIRSVGATYEPRLFWKVKPGHCHADSPLYLCVDSATTPQQAEMLRFWIFFALLPLRLKRFHEELSWSWDFLLALVFSVAASSWVFSGGVDWAAVLLSVLLSATGAPLRSIVVMLAFWPLLLMLFTD